MMMVTDRAVHGAASVSRITREEEDGATYVVSVPARYVTASPTSAGVHLDLERLRDLHAVLDDILGTTPEA